MFLFCIVMGCWGHSSYDVLFFDNLSTFCSLNSSDTDINGNIIVVRSISVWILNIFGTLANLFVFV